MKANHRHAMKTPCTTPIGGIIFPSINPLEHPETFSSLCTAVRSSYGGRRRNDHTGPRRIQRPPLPLPHHIHDPRIWLPLLSIFVSLFSIDNATLNLVAHSPAHSALFPGPIHPSNDSKETGNAQGFHGNLFLLGPSRPHAVLRGGLAVACEEFILPSNPFKMSASPMIDLLSFVREIWAGGRTALRKVYG